MRLNKIESIEYQVKMINTYDKYYYVNINSNYVEIRYKDRVCASMSGAAAYQNALMYLYGLLEGYITARYNPQLSN